MLINCEENLGHCKWMEIDGLDSVVGNEMGLTCKHEFQSWTCVVVIEIQLPLKLDKENDLHKPPANPTSQKVNKYKEKTLANKPHFFE